VLGAYNEQQSALVIQAGCGFSCASPHFPTPCLLSSTMARMNKPPMNNRWETALYVAAAISVPVAMGYVGWLLFRVIP
jgi:hypothetical protein